MFDLLKKLETEMGLPVDSTKTYLNNELMEQDVYLTDKVNDGSVITVICTGKPTIPFTQVVRETLNQVKIADVRYLNVSDKFKPWTEWSYTEGFDFDQEGKRMQWPIYRDWTQEAA